MSSDNIKAVILRALDDKEYLQKLLENPNEALDGFELSEEERATLSNLTLAEFEDMTGGGIEQRLSMSLEVKLSKTKYCCD